MNKFILALIIINIFTGLTFAKEIEVKIKPTQKVTTSKIKLMEGDVVDFEVVSPKPLVGKKVSGIVTSINSNNWASEEATLLIENFKLEDGQKLNGLVYKKGNSHSNTMNFVYPALNIIYNYVPIIHPDYFPLIRGGEVQIKDKHEFTLFLEENDEKSRL